MHEGLDLQRGVAVTVFEVQAVAIFWVGLVLPSASIQVQTLSPPLV